jgi:enoyl-CoA hydratase/carnithine racemase
VRSLHAPEELIPAARAIAREIADNTSAVSVSLARTLMWRGLCSSHPMEAHMADSRATQARGGSHDAREGINSFLQKRPARYQDRVSTDLPNVFPFWNEPEFR